MMSDCCAPSHIPSTLAVLVALTPAVLALTGCASGGGAADPGAYPSPVSSDSTAIAEANRQILQAASLDRLNGSSEPVADEYVIGPGDRVEVDVFGVDNLSGSFAVGESGTISLPLLGAVQCAGYTPVEMAASVEDQLRATYMKDPHVTVQVSEMGSHGVSVLGAVRSPGVYQISGRTTVLDVLAMAEGLSEDAGQTVIVARSPSRSRAPDGSPERGIGPAMDSAASLAGPVSTTSAAQRPDTAQGEIHQIDLQALLEPGGSSENLVVLPGDVVQVRPAGLVYVVGEVNRPGGFTIPPGKPMSVLQALALAQGLGNTAAAGRSVIVRTLDDGSREEVAVPLDDVLKGSKPPPTLRDKDVLFVPKNGAKAFALGAANALVRMVSLRGWIY